MLNKTHASFISADVEKVSISTDRFFFSIQSWRSLFRTSLGLIIAFINHDPAQYDGDGEAKVAFTSQAAKDFSPLSVLP